MFMPALLVCILDSRFITSRRYRGLLGIALMGTVAVSACVVQISWLEVNKIDSLVAPGDADWEDPDFAWSIMWFLLFGASYAGYQMCTEYTLSSTTNDPSRLAHVAGMFKFYSTLGMMISFILAGERVPFIAQASLQLAWVLIRLHMHSYSVTDFLTAYLSWESWALSGCSFSTSRIRIT